VDLQWASPSGLAFYADYLGRYTRGVGGGAATAYDQSLLGQVSYLFDKNWEVFGRYDYIHFDTKTTPAGVKKNIDEITGGVNYYLYGQNVKVTGDATYLPNGAPND